MVLATNPGHSATVLVELAVTAGTCRNKSAGKDMKLPPPANAFSVPAIPAAKSKKMVCPKCKPICTRGANPDEQVAWNSGPEYGDNLSGICQETPLRFLQLPKTRPSLSRRMGSASTQPLNQKLTRAKGTACDSL